MASFVEGGSIGGAIGGSVGGGIAAVSGLEGAASVSGLSLNFGAPAFEAAPSLSFSGISSLESFGPELTAPVFAPVNEGPVGPGFRLEDTVPLAVNTLDAGKAVAEAELILSEAAKPDIGVVPDIFRTSLSDISLDPTPAEPIGQALYWFSDEPTKVVKPKEVIFFQREPLTAPLPKIEEEVKVDLNIQTDIEPNAGSRTFPETSTKVAAQSILKEKEIEEIVEEQVTSKNQEQIIEEEEVEKKVYLEDEEVSAQRKYEVRQATLRAKFEAFKLGLKKIPGWLLAKFLPPEHEGNRSQVIKKTGPDGSYQETVEAIRLSGEFGSEYEAVAWADEVVSEKKPVKYGSQGRPVSTEDVARVFKNRITKGAKPHHIEVIKRIVKKRVLVREQIQPVNQEGRIEDYPQLVEVFQKAA